MNTTRHPKRQKISFDSVFEQSVGYSRAVCEGRWVFVAGTTGFDYDTMTIADDVRDQCRQTLENIGRALRQAGCGFDDIVRTTYIFPHAEDFELCWPILREYFGEIRPASTMFSAALADPRMKIEIEVTALKHEQDRE